MTLQCENLQVRPEIQDRRQDTGYDGSKHWGVIHDETEKIQCPFCKSKGVKQGHGWHDAVNAHVGHKVRYPEDLKFMTEYMIHATELYNKKKMRCKLCG